MILFATIFYIEKQMKIKACIFIKRFKPKDMFSSIFHQK